MTNTTTSRGKFRVFKSKKNNRWYWTMIAANGEPIGHCGQSNGFKNTHDAIEDIREFKTVVSEYGIDAFSFFFGKEKLLYFRVELPKSGVLLASEAYTSTSARARGRKSVIDNINANVNIEN